MCCVAVMLCIICWVHLLLCCYFCVCVCVVTYVYMCLSSYSPEKEMRKFPNNSLYQSLLFPSFYIENGIEISVILGFGIFYEK